MQTITIKRKVEKEQEIQIALPFFRKYEPVLGCIHYFGGIDKDTFINIYTSVPARVSISTNEQSLVEAEILEAFTMWETIDEEEFLKAHADTLASLSLKPVLMEIPLSVVDDPNDLKEVNI